MKNQRTIVLSVLAVAILCLAVVGLSFAYFSSSSSSDGEVKVNVETSNQAYIYYDTGEDFELFAKQPGYSDELTFSVKLVGENKVALTSTYDVNMYIDSNTFEYDPKTNENTPELLFDVYMSTDKVNWNEVMLNKDATELSGTVNFVNDQKITAEANSETTHYWKVVFRYVSLDKDQSYNMNKEFISSIKVENVE